MGQNRAAYVLGLKEIKVSEAPMPICGDNEAIVKIAYCGVCGSDVHFYEQGEEAFPNVYPFILGHECSGTVTEIGKNVKNLRVGDRVALEPGKACGECEWCKSGKYNLCPNVSFISAPVCNGAMRNYIAHPAGLCFKLPDSMSLMSGALIEPLAVGLHGARQAESGPGKTAVILGCGCIGLVTLLASKLYQADRVIMVDVFDIRLDKARELGADYVVNSAREDPVKAVMKLTNGLGADIVFETAGNPVTTAMTGKLAKRGGVITLIGNTPGKTPFEFLEIMNKEITIKSVFRYRNIYPLAIEAISSGRLHIEGIVSRIFELEDAKKAFDTALTEKQSNVKIVLRIGHEE